jgi:hypothetical protein
LIAGVFLALFSLRDMPSNVNSFYFSTFILSIVLLALCIGIIIWEISKFKQKRLPFKQDRRTKVLTVTALSTSVASFSLLSAFIVLRALQYFGLNLAILLVLGVVGFIVASVMYEDFLPEQVAAGYVVEPQVTTP